MYKDKDKQHRTQRAWYAANRGKICAQRRNWKKKQREKNEQFYTEINLKNRYKLTLEDYNRMFAEQEGCCAICGRHQSILKNRLGVDHDHTTGRVRGLLCSNCNAALGQIQDNIQTLKNMVKYLMNFSNELCGNRKN